MEMIHLRSTTLHDLDFVVQAEQHADNRPFIIEWTREQHAAVLADPDLAHVIIQHASGGPVGFVILAGLTNFHGSLEFRRIVVTAKRQGIGRSAVRLVKQIAFAQYRAHRLWLDVKANNNRACRLYESEGFVAEGTLRECLRSECGYESLLVMSILASEYGAASPGDAVGRAYTASPGR